MDDITLKFGKHKGKEISSVMQIDPKYVEWLVTQDWFADKNPMVYNVVNNITTSESSCTPEHNALQARFLDDVYIEKILHKCLFVEYSKSINKIINKIYSDCPLYKFFEETLLDSISIRNKKFEVANVDVRCDIIFNIKNRINGYKIRDIEELSEREIQKNNNSSKKLEQIEEFVKQKKEWEKDYLLKNAIFELKPTIGDDYPDILRQIKRYIPTKYSVRKEFKAFVAYDKYTGKGISEETMKKIFLNEEIYTVNLSQLDDIDGDFNH